MKQARIIAMPATSQAAHMRSRRRLFLYRPRYSRRKASSRSISSRVPMVIRR